MFNTVSLSESVCLMLRLKSTHIIKETHNQAKHTHTLDVYISEGGGVCVEEGNFFFFSGINRGKEKSDTLLAITHNAVR